MLMLCELRAWRGGNNPGTDIPRCSPVRANASFPEGASDPDPDRLRGEDALLKNVEYALVVVGVADITLLRSLRGDVTPAEPGDTLTDGIGTLAMPATIELSPAPEDEAVAPMTEDVRER